MTKSSVENGNGVKVIGDLFEFLERAKKHAHYPPNTAASAKAALRLVESVLTEQEAASLDTFRDNIDGIFQRVFNANKSRLSALSFQTYKSKVNMLISDYERYGRDPQAMAAWKRKTRVTTLKKDSGSDLIPGDGGPGNTDSTSTAGGLTLSRLEIVLRSDAKAILLIPRDLTALEAKRIKALLDACVVSE